MNCKDLEAKTSLSKQGTPLRRSKYQIFPPLPTDRHEALQTSIAHHGVEKPTTWDDQGNLLDGWEREVCCAELGKNCPREVRHSDTEADKFQFILAVNAHRRPCLNSKQKRLVIEAYLLGDAEMADNSLAQALGVSKNSVAKIRHRLEAARKIKKVKTTRGKDGKQRPVTYAKRIITNTPNEFKKATEIIKDLPEICVGRTVDLTTAKRLAKAERHGLDFVPTPEAVTLALLQRERFDGTIWEPACGTGAVATLLEKTLPNPVLASDLVNYGYGKSGVNFLDSSTPADNIVTNPPFSFVVKFKRKALQLARRKVALLMYCRQLGDEVESQSPLKTVYVFTEKINFEGAKLGWLMAWYVWEIGYDGPITVERVSLAKNAECQIHQAKG